MPVVLFAVLVVLQVAYPQVPDAWRDPLTVATVLCFFGVSATHAALHGPGPAWAARFLGTAAAVGLVAELIGVATGLPFGDYRYEGGLGPSVGGVPLLIPLAWAMMAYPAWAVARLLVDGARPGAAARRIGLAAAALASWDLFLDPQMVRFGYWSWVGGGAYQDVPLQNFAGWLVVGVVLFAIARRTAGDANRLDESALSLPVALFAWTWIGETFAFLRFFDEPQVALVGGVGMGVIALPALLVLARRRRVTLRRSRRLHPT